jgi:PTS system sucrose-specific IIC component
MDFEQISRSLLPLLGGKENIASAAHCGGDSKADE